MGIPKFFRYVSERYPCITEKVKNHQIPEFDNLYLDANGIIHTCSHPDDKDVNFRISEETIFKNIFRYLELLFHMVQPQKLFFVAIDGVAPRAKINQQRARRFRYAKDIELQEKEAHANGTLLSTEKRFDSNCITPGTLFMSKIDEQLRYFITYKISTDKLWQKCKVIYSGPQVPGEGEHKIMDYIRYMKAQPDYDVNTKHCLYGLDADLIMLGLCIHEIQFTLLREEVIFSIKAKNVHLSPAETNFCLFHLSLLRDYIDHEFSSLKQKLPFPYDREKIIDDWILMAFLVGNDFIPHLPNLHIAHGALAVLSHVYMDVLPTLDGYINEAGTLKLDRFEKFMDRLSRFDILQFSEYYTDLKYLESKTGRNLTGTYDKQEKIKYENNEEAMSPKRVPDKEFDTLLRSAAEMTLGTNNEPWDEDESDNESCIMEFVQHKKDYYINKLKYENIDEDFLRSQTECYIRAIQWNLNYYYNGCCSWGWYYPHHYAPYISDIKGFANLKFEFDLGEPFSPFEQLLAVLPPYSKDLLPSAFQHLVTEEQSPIIDYYPKDFQTDLNGKEHSWEAIVLIPFVNEERLRHAMAPHYKKLTSEEYARNKHGPMSIYVYTKENVGIYKAPVYFEDITNHAKVQLLNHDDIIIPYNKLVKGVSPGVNLDLYYPGFPTLRYIEHTTSLKLAKVKVFQSRSRRESMILHVTPSKITDFTTAATNLLGSIVYVNWPHIIEATVIGVSNSEIKLCREMKHIPETVNKRDWDLLTMQIRQTYNDSMGIDIGEIDCLVHVRLLTGKKFNFNSHGVFCVEKQWSDTESSYAYQTVVKDISVYSNNIQPHLSIKNVFVPGKICYMLGHPFYGSSGKVQDPPTSPGSNRIKVSMVTVQEPSFEVLKQMHARIQRQYMHINIVAQRLGVNNVVLRRITGDYNIEIPTGETGKDYITCNLGLGLKYIKKNEEAPGYTKKLDNGQWLYSPKAVSLICSYMSKCPELFEHLAQDPVSGNYKLGNIFNNAEKWKDIAAWLKEQVQEINTCACGSVIIDSSVVKKMEEEVDAYLKISQKSTKIVEMQVQPHLLYIPELYQRSVPPDDKAQTQIFDRICCIRENFTVPLGHKGTVISVRKSESTAHIMYDVLFDKPFDGGHSINGSSKFQAYCLSPTDFINISYGERVEHRRVTMETSVDLAKTRNSTPNQHVQVRTNASAFASYKNRRTYVPSEPSSSPRRRIIQRNTDRVNQQDQSPHTFISTTSSHHTAIPREATKASEFQAIWNELYKKQEPNSVVQQAPINLKTKQINYNLPDNLSQDPSAFLKAVLKISDEDTRQSGESSTSATINSVNSVEKKVKVQDTPPLVQQLFDHARKNKEVQDDKPSIWYCCQLLNYYQLVGVGMPRYSYVPYEESNLVEAHILLPDRRIFVGDPRTNHEQAAESAAKKAYMALKLSKILPNTKTLQPPPQHWYFNPGNNIWSHNIRSPPIPADLINQQIFPEQIQKRHQNMEYQHATKQTEKSQQVVVSKSSHNTSKPETKDCPTFVPLQAQKKSRRIIASKEVASKNDTNQNSKSHPQPVVKEKKMEHCSKVTKVEIINITEKKQEQTEDNELDNTQPIVKPKKSRVAAKFGILPQTEKIYYSKN